MVEVTDKDVVEVGFMAFRMDSKAFTQPMTLYAPKKTDGSKRQVIDMKRVSEILRPRMEQFFVNRNKG